MEQPVIFKNPDVYKTTTDSLCSLKCCHSCANEKFSDYWFLTPPKFTTIRINTLLSSIEELEGFVKKSLAIEAKRRRQEPPQVQTLQGLPELLVLDPWAPEPLPRPQREVVVDAACGAAVLRGANVFAPGVLAVPADTQEEDYVSVHADTAGSCLRGLTVPYNDLGKIYVGSGVMRMSREQLFKNDLHPKGVAVEMTRPASNVSSVSVPPHMGQLQNLPSVVCGRVLDPRPGDKVIDLCAAPGHKTTHLAALMTNQGILIALDKIVRKVEALKCLCQTMGADIVQAFTHDATKAVSAEGVSGDWVPPFPPATFDRVLLDAPCSALGQRPQLGNCISTKQIHSYPRLQKKLFDSAVQLLKPGGYLVYSTCSITLEENEDIVSWALNRYSQLELVPALPVIGRPGCCKSSLSETQQQMVQRFGLPAGSTPQLDTIGFFIAKFTKLR